MQKKIIALAVAGLVSGAAFADTNVVLYGVADIYFGSTNITSVGRVNAVNSGGGAGSRIGLKGAEELGGGLKAIFTYETSVNLDDGTTTTAGLGTVRQSFVGLEGGFGKVIAGRLQSPGLDFTATYTPDSGMVNTSQKTVAKAAGTSITNSDAARFNNAVEYVSPTFSGVTLKTLYAATTESTLAARTNEYALSADYVAGPFAIGYTAQHFVPVATVAVTAKTVDQAIGAKYNFGPLTAFATYQTVKVSNNPANKVWSLGASAPVGKAGTFIASYAKFDDESAADKNAKAFSLSYQYALSKRTKLYAIYNNLTNDNNGSAVLAGTAPVGVSAKSNQVVAGINHSF